MRGRPSAGALPAAPRDDDGTIVKATLIGGVAVLLWSTLPTLTALSGAVPPLQLTAMAFAVAFAVSLTSWLVRGGGLAGRFAWPPKAWAVGLCGLCGYHFCFFAALRHAPPAEASLINYLWPLLIVVMSSLLPGERLRWWHVAGTVAGLAGAVLLVTDGGRVVLQGQYAAGYGFALGAALIWSSYSVLNRVLARGVPTEAVGAFCGAVAIVAAACHIALETTLWPTGWQWLVVVALGLGPVGGAVFFWDHGCKRGDIRVLGAFAYLTPLLATALLVVVGLAPPSWVLAVACLFIAGGAILASRDFFRRRRQTIAVQKRSETG